MTHRTDGTRGTLTLDPADLACDWPMRSHLVLGSLPTAPSCARLHTRLVLAEWGMSRLTEDAELCVSEMVTNGIQASEGLLGSWFGGEWAPGAPPVRLWLLSDGTSVLIKVWDASDRKPEPKGMDLEAVSGRGLMLVDTLSQEWGSYVPESASGKVVWAVVTGRGL